VQRESGVAQAMVDALQALERARVDLVARRDATLEMPVLILPSVQINIRAGERPPAEANGTAYLKIPMDAL
jgi:hypothetical protein